MKKAFWVLVMVMGAMQIAMAADNNQSDPQTQALIQKCESMVTVTKTKGMLCETVQNINDLAKENCLKPEVVASGVITTCLTKACSIQKHYNSVTQASLQDYQKAEKLQVKPMMKQINKVFNCKTNTPKPIKKLRKRGKPPHS